MWILLSQPGRRELLLLLPFIATSRFLGFLPNDTFAPAHSIQPGDVGFIVLLLLGLLFIGKRKEVEDESRFRKVHLTLAGLFLSFLIAVLILSFLQYGELWDALMVFRRYFWYSSLFIFVYMMERLNTEEVRRLVFLIENLTIVLAILYVIDFGLGVRIFAVKSYMQISFAGHDLRRNFLAVPSFSIFTLAILVLERNASFRVLVGTGAILIMSLLTYTRDYVVAVLVVVVASSLVWLSFNGLRAKRLAIMGFAVLVIAIASLNVFGGQLGYFMSRVGEIQTSGGIGNTGDFRLREDLILSRIQLALHSNPITGAGFMGDRTSAALYPGIFVRPHDTAGQLLNGDQSWGNIITSIGFGGCALMLAIVLYPVFYLVRTRSFMLQDLVVYAALIALFVEFFIIAFFGTNLTNDALQICFCLAITERFIIPKEEWLERDY